MDAVVNELVRAVEDLLVQQAALERQWVGTRVRLREPFGQLRGNGRVVLPQGKVGFVVRVRLVQEAPLVLRFPGLAMDVAPLPYTLQVVDDSS